MAIKKTVLPTGEIKWDVRIYEDGRDGKRTFKRFSRKQEAQDYVDLQRLKKTHPHLVPQVQTLYGQPSNQINGQQYGYAQPREPEKPKVLFLDEADRWLMEREMNFSPGHKKRAVGVIKEFRERLQGIDVYEVNQDFLYRIQREERAKGQSNGSINRKTEIFSAILTYAHRLGRIDKNPGFGFKKLKRDTPEMGFWSLEEARSFLNFVNLRYESKSKDRWIYVVYLLALNTGLRAGEIWGLRPQDVGWDRNLIHVKRQYDRVLNKMRDPKSKRSRVVPCSDELKRELSELLKKRKLTASTTIFQSINGKPVCHDNFSDRVFQRDMRDWGGKRIRFHDMRHTAATLMISSGVDLKTVKEICGHSDIQTTMNYAHLVSGSIEHVARSFLIAPVSEKESKLSEEKEA